MSAIGGAAAMDRQIGASGPANRFSEVSTEDFIRIIFAELTNQDPLEPSDTSALLQQLDSIRSIESNIRLGQQLEKLVSENQLASASNMIGRWVGGMTEDFTRVAGQVVAVAREAGEIFLELDMGARVPANRIELIVDPQAYTPAVPPAAAAPAPPVPPAPPSEPDI